MNSKKYILLFFLILLSKVNSFNFDDYDYNNLLINPYRVLGLPPWSSMKEVKKKYRNLNNIILIKHIKILLLNLNLFKKNMKN